MQSIHKTRLALLSALSFIPLLTSPCVLHAAPLDQPAGETGPLQYVALGSSFAAGPGLPAATDGKDSTPCGRSSVNYAHLLAKQRQFALKDVSCGGATTANLLDAGQHGAAAQLDAVTAKTSLVTVTIGGNDVFYLRTVGALACQQQPVKPGDKPSPYCASASPLEIETAFSSLSGHLHAVASQVHQRAPSARLIFVGYLDIVPPAGTCARLQLTAADAAQVREIASRLNQVTMSVARDEHADFLDASALSRDHNACSPEPWINGFSTPDTSGQFATVPFHPNAAGMAALATSLDHLLASNQTRGAEEIGEYTWDRADPAQLVILNCLMEHTVEPAIVDLLVGDSSICSKTVALSIAP